MRTAGADDSIVGSMASAKRGASDTQGRASLEDPRSLINNDINATVNIQQTPSVEQEVHLPRRAASHKAQVPMKV